eukprot:1161907-Pelagomonas_calceolata.AAC.9
MQAGLHLSGIGHALGAGRHHGPPCRSQQQQHCVAEFLPARNAGPASTSEPCWQQGRNPAHSRRRLRHASWNAGHTLSSCCRPSVRRILCKAVEEQQIAAAGTPSSNVSVLAQVLVSLLVPTTQSKGGSTC